MSANRTAEHFLLNADTSLHGHSESSEERGAVVLDKSRQLQLVQKWYALN